MGHDVALGLTVFIACAVEMVEALTVVLALGISRDWKSVLLATGAAIATLAVVVLVFGAPLLRISDESSPSLRRLWLIFGFLLLVFGVQWVKKSILRMAGVLTSRDENAIFGKLTKEAKAMRKIKGQNIDWYAFAVTYKSVLLEGFEVIFIVITFGVSQGDLSLGVAAAAVALVTITLLGLLTHRPLSRVPENTMKLVVGVMLTSFGSYFSVKGLGVSWPHGETAIWAVLAFYTVLSYGLLQWAQLQYLPKEKA